MLFEAEGSDEPVDGGEGVAVTKARDDGGAAVFGLICHSGKSVMGALWPSWKNRGVPPSLLPAHKCPEFIDLGVTLTCKIVTINGLCANSPISIS